MQYQYNIVILDEDLFKFLLDLLDLFNSIYKIVKLSKF